MEALMSIRYTIPDQWRSQIPERSRAVLERWVNDGNRGKSDLSGFYYALISGNAFRAAGHADPANLAALGLMLRVIYTDFPAESFGSPEAVARWQGVLAEEASRVYLDY